MEIEKEWTLCEIADAHEALDVQAEAEEAERKKHASKGKGGR